MNDIIYLDNASTTQVDKRVLEEMIPYFNTIYSNSSSKHSFGGMALNSVNNSRTIIAELINAEPGEIIFTSGATEAINLAIKGVAANYLKKGKHIITVQTEHSAVLDVCKYLETIGYEITYLPVDEFGLINLDQLKISLRPDTILVSVMYVNNEIGVIQPIKKISEITHENNSLFMTDATQAFGKITIDVNELGIDLMSFSGHKIYGPKGVGALYIRSRDQNKAKILPLLHGGGQERGLRSGTLNVPGIIGLRKAAEIAIQDMKHDYKRIKNLRDTLETKLLKINNSFINGHKEQRIYNIVNICFKGADADAVITRLKNIAVSNGSACTSTSILPSHVLKALGKNDEEAFSSIRFSLGRFNTSKDIGSILLVLPNLIKMLRTLNTD